MPPDEVGEDGGQGNVDPRVLQNCTGKEGKGRIRKGGGGNRGKEEEEGKRLVKGGLGKRGRGACVCVYMYVHDSFDIHIRT